jgi:hypothetical protein
MSAIATPDAPTYQLPENDDLLKQYLEKYNSIPTTGNKPRMGDILRLPQPDPRMPKYMRFCAFWPDTIQTCGLHHGSFHINEGGISFSGGLDPGVKRSDIIPSQNQKTKEAVIWFFDRGLSGANRGIHTSAHFHVFDVKPDADLSKIFSRQPGLFIQYWGDHATSNNGYRWTVTKDATARTAFKTEAELNAWLVRNNLALKHDITQSQSVVWPHEVA